MISRLYILMLCFLACALLDTGALCAADGLISGSVEKPASLKAVTAVERKSGRRYKGTVDPDGRFSVAKLPQDASYDLQLDFQDGSRLEGVDLRVPASEYVEEQPLVEEDIQSLQEKVTALSKFEQVVDVLSVTGNIQHAAVLVNKLRTEPFYNSKPGEVVWRAELWRFERPDETWVKVQEELFVVLYRQRMMRSAYDKQSITFDPALGGLTPTEKPEIDLGVVVPPDPKPGIRVRNMADQLVVQTQEQP